MTTSKANQMNLTLCKIITQKLNLSSMVCCTNLRGLISSKNDPRAASAAPSPPCFDQLQNELPVASHQWWAPSSACCAITGTLIRMCSSRPNPLDSSCVEECCKHWGVAAVDGPQDLLPGRSGEIPRPPQPHRISDNATRLCYHR